MSWIQQFEEIDFPIVRIFDSGTTDWHFYEISRQPFGLYGLGFNETSGVIFTRYTWDCQVEPEIDFLKSWYRRIRYCYEALEELTYPPELCYDPENTALVLKISTQLTAAEDFGARLDALMEIMDRSLHELFKSQV